MRTGLDWTGKYPSAIAALANVKAKTVLRHTVGLREDKPADQVRLARGYAKADKI
jgi:ATP-dependent DNA ligase